MRFLPHFASNLFNSLSLSVKLVRWHRLNVSIKTYAYRGMLGLWPNNNNSSVTNRYKKLIYSNLNSTSAIRQTTERDKKDALTKNNYLNIKYNYS